jgi:Leucine-rich repeat (LRR) protein
MMDVFMFRNRRQRRSYFRRGQLTSGCLISALALISCHQEPGAPESHNGKPLSSEQAFPEPRRSTPDSLPPQPAFRTALKPDANPTVIECDQKISADEFAEICRRKKLKTLILDGGGVSASQIGQLTGLTHLEHLRIRNCQLNDTGISQLITLKKLRIVNFPQAQFTDGGLEKLAALPNLQLLRFASPLVTDQGLAFLKNSMTLRALHLIHVNATDQAVDELCNIQSLESLYLDGSKLSDDGFARIFKLRPDLHLHVDQVHLDLDPNRHEHPPSPSH